MWTQGFRMSFLILCTFLVIFQNTLSRGESDGVVSIGNAKDLSIQYLRTKLSERLVTRDGVFASNSSDILPFCKALVSEYSKQSSLFIACSIDNARPFKFCEGCVVHYKKTITIYSDILENNEKYDNCRDLLLSSDRVQVIKTVHNDILGIWNTADCSKCFGPITEDNNGTVHYNLTEDTQQFLILYSNFTNCIPQAFNTTERNDTVCDDCRPYYRQMNSLFDKLLNDQISPHHVCMDIVDIMNYTRLTWGDKLNCTVTQKQRIPVIIMSCFLFLIPAIFYSVMAVYGTKKERTLMKQKRLLSSSGSLNYHTNEYLMGNDSSSSNDSSRRNSRSGTTTTASSHSNVSHRPQPR